MKPRSVGVESLGLYALSQLGFVEKLSVGINGVMRAAILGNVIGRMAKPASELATWNWLQRHSALGELMDFDFEAMPHTRLYHASDVLMKHRKVIEDHIFSAVQTLFGLDETVTLYDLTNTYFEGEAEGNSKAKRGHSKEKRSDCSLVTLGLVLDGSGFVRRSRTFAGNVAECSTLEGMLEGLDAPQGALVIMDRGIATEANVGWLVEHGYRYQIELMTDKSGKLVTGLTWNKVPVDGTMVTHPGVYCLRSNETGWDEEKLWRTYTMLTDLESVFRSLKSELGLR
uniref:IS1634 family transposase n=1 Tax=Ferrovum sp. TaxID=2609467 RepID=UPI003450870F